MTSPRRVGLTAKLLISSSISVVGLNANLAIGQAPLSLSERYDAVVEIARDLVLSRPELLENSVEPDFRICNARHLHWNIGSPSCSFESEPFPMAERLRIEWFWKHLSQSERRFLSQYLHIREPILRYMQVAAQRDLTEEEVSAYRNNVLSIYHSAFAEYARRRGVTPVPPIPTSPDAIPLEPVPLESQDGYGDDYAAPAAPCYVQELSLPLVPRVSPEVQVASIQWISAGTVWSSICKTGREPEFRNYAPNQTAPVFSGSIYYYKLTLGDGRQMTRKLAPGITRNTSEIQLPWQ